MKLNKPMKKWEKEMSRNLSKEQIQISRHTKKCSYSLATREMQTKPTLWFHLPPVRMAYTGTATDNSYSILPYSIVGEV